MALCHEFNQKAKKRALVHWFESSWWISWVVLLSGSIALVNKSSTGTWRWNEGEPNNFEKEKCVEIQDIYVKSKSVSLWLCRSYVDPIKNHSKEKKSSERTLIFKRVTHIPIFFLVCSTISNKSENDDIFIEGTARPRSTPQPLATTTKSFPLRTQLMITRISCFQKVRFTLTEIWHLILP